MSPTVVRMGPIDTVFVRKEGMPGCAGAAVEKPAESTVAKRSEGSSLDGIRYSCEARGLAFHA
jgi:hypothetical protein